MVKNYSDPIGVETIKRLSKEFSMEEPKLTEIIQKYRDDFMDLRFSLVSGVASLIYCDFISRMYSVEQPVMHINTPTLHNVSILCYPNSPLIHMIQSVFINRINTDVTYQTYKNTIGGIDIFESKKLSGIRNRWMDRIIIPEMGMIPTAIEARFYNRKNQLFREDRELELFDGHGPTSAQISFIINQVVCNFICARCDTINEEHQIRPEIGVGCSISPERIITIIDDMGICPINISMETLSNEECLPLIEFVTGIRKKSDTSFDITHTNSLMYMTEINAIE